VHVKLLIIFILITAHLHC